MKWRDIPGFEGYMASECGRLKTINRIIKWSRGIDYKKKGKMLIGHPDKTGYISHTIKCINNKKTYLSHRLIALAWLPNPENKMFVNHKNGIKHDNRVSNLEWCTKPENGIHAVLNGLHRPMIGETNGNSRLTAEIVLKIRKDTRISKLIANEYNIGRTTVQYIKRRKLWQHL